MEKISEGISENIEDGCNIRKTPRLDSLSSCILQFLAKLKIIINIIVYNILQDVWLEKKIENLLESPQFCRCKEKK